MNKIHSMGLQEKDNIYFQNNKINPIFSNNNQNDYDSETELDYIGNTHNYFCNKIRNCMEYLLLFFT